MKSSRNAFEFLINHVILPAKLPQQEENTDIERSGEQLLLQLLSEALDLFLTKSSPEAREKWKPVCYALRGLWDMTNGLLDSKAAMEKNLKNLKPGDAMIVFVRAQNSGLLFFREDAGNVLVHAFEASAVSEDVMQSQDRLIWRFPGQTISFGSELLEDRYFTDELAAMLQQMSNEHVESSMPTTKKALSIVTEERETANPRLVTEALIPMLCAWGGPRKGPEVIKHVRDDVNWDRSRLPWRRSPFWLVLRVSMQILLSHTFPEDQARYQYKNFMAFFMARICTNVVHEHAGADVRMVAAVKTARRLSKLGDQALPYVGEAVQSAVAAIRAGLDSSWSEFQTQQLLSIPKLSQQATDDDCILSLTNSREYLHAVTRGQTEKSRLPELNLEAGPRLEFKADGLPRLHRTTDTALDPVLLTDFETWVMEDLQSWTKSREGTPADCDSLLVEFRAYLDFAREAYAENPRALSVMILAVLEIWRNLDILCLQVHPLMRKFPPEIPMEFGRPLLLPHRCQMKILDRIETHLAKRWQESDSNNPPILGQLSSRSFCIQFYAQSEAHQRMRKKIEAEAGRRREAKRSEWTERSEEYRQLMRDESRMSHSYFTGRWGESIHAGSCEKCQTSNQANNMQIDVDEWPLPSDETQAKSVIFELDCPTAFSAWRDATWLIIQYLGRPEQKSGDDLRQLVLEYDPLSTYACPQGRIITLGSYTKSFLRSHYRNQYFPVEFTKISVNNGLRYELVDTSTSCWVRDQSHTPKVDRHCTSMLPTGPYSNLQDFVDTTSCSPNEGLASQHSCTAEIATHEFLAFASLRAGERIQWLNIIRELGSADLSFNAPAVHVLLRQTALQAGSRAENTILRAAHVHFEDLDFCSQLVDLLESHLSNVTSNWKEQSRLATIALLGLRALTLSSHASVASRIIRMLREVRSVALAWCREISGDIDQCPTEDATQRMRNFINMSALTCRMTYNIDHGNMHLVLADQCDVASFVESSIYLNDNYSAHQHVPVEIEQAILLDKKFSRNLQARLRELIEGSRSGVNTGITNAYGLEGLNARWELLAGKENRWLCSTRVVKSDSASQSCHYDILSGTFLLDWRRIGRLPPEYMRAPIYARLFGSRILNVTQSHLSRMEYMSVKLINGHEVHLMMEEGELLVEAKIGDSHLRLIPHTILKPDLPESLSENFVHWMDLESGEIEFRALASAWNPPRRPWKLHLHNSAGPYMDMDSRRLLDRESRLARSILDILQTLERRDHIIVTSNVAGVEIEIPRMRLTFTVNRDGSLESKQLGAIVDPDQDIGCLIGLRNKLVLRHLDLHPSTQERSVLVPYGECSINKHGDHSQVEIGLGHTQKLSFMHYQLDTRLARLRNQQGFLSQLYLAYLHAVTSSVVPDPLTGYTGTQEALRILREQSLRTSTPISEEAVPLLNKIAALTPARHFYPKNLKKMQTIEWDSHLGELMQHEDFQTLVADIVLHASQVSMLQPGPNAASLLKDRGNPDLLRRASNRNSSVRNTDLGVREKNDSLYHARDGDLDSDGPRRVYEAATLVRLWPQTHDVVQDLEWKVRRWGRISNYSEPPDFSTLTCNDLLEFPIGDKWGSLYELCRGCDRQVDQHRLMRLFSMIAFEQDGSLPVVRTLLAVACSPQFKEIRPLKPSYDLTSGESLDRHQIQNTVSAHIEQPKRRHGESKDLWDLRLKEFRHERNEEVQSAVNRICSQWPCDAPSVLQAGHLLHGKEYLIQRECEILFTAWNDNRKFMMHISGLQSELSKIHRKREEIPRLIPVSRLQLTHHKTSIAVAPDLTSLLHARVPPSSSVIPAPLEARRPHQCAKYLPGLEELEATIHSMKNDSDATRRAYAEDLEASLKSLKEADVPETPRTIPLSNNELLTHQAALTKQFADSLRSLNLALSPKTVSELSLRDAGLWPRIDAASLLACLSAHRRASVPCPWKEFLVSLGELLSSLQRLERLLSFSHRNDVLGFYKEAEEPGHQSWSATDFPDWLLIEIENNLTIREIQAEVAQKMIQPDRGENAVLQLNMGEGKSSVIVPMVMTALSDGKSLGRLVVLKPLLKQTLDLLSQRLGGLVDRRIFHAPFTRENRLDETELSQLRAHFGKCQQDQCIVVTLPEHMMSFRLMGRERLQTQPQLAWEMVGLEKWLSATCRDVLDESDAILDPRFQLVYSMGTQRIMDGQPERWVITQRVLALFAREASRLQSEGSRDVEVDLRGRSFPIITFLNPDIGPTILDRVVDEIQRGNLLGLSLSHCTPSVRQAAVAFIRDRSVPQPILELVEQEFGNFANWKILLLLRGLIANNILLFAFQQKRWLVNYGLDLSRCMMAVPYRAKGVPSMSAEFGHPDVAIVLTCLSYYYSGLTPEQLRQAFDNLFRGSDPDSEYDLWARDCPNISIQSLRGVNLEDERSWEESIYPQLRFSKSAADYFMTSIVFPHEGKEFPAKLSTSAWDIPSEMQATTGFSGTNDNKFLLPLSIRQNDLPQLHRTNAMVANMLLQRENREYVEAKDTSGKKLSVEGLLALLCSQTLPVTVLIDVGAQVLEASNEDVARKWLQLSPNSPAAVFFNEADELRVVDRHGFVEQLSRSAFHRNLDKCLIYLDEVHTRGVDIKMPTHARAAVTLGPKTTKDRLVQACMRMRKLGCHQSLIFFAPPEVHQEIMALSGKEPGADLDSRYVLGWSFDQTCRATSSIKPLWIMQGLEHSHRKRLCAEYLQGSALGPSQITEFCTCLEEPEGRTLYEMYGEGSGQAVFRSCLTDEEAHQEPTVQKLLSEWELFKEGHSRDWSLQEEQEREIAHEVEQERELQRPPPAKALRHEIDPALRKFIQNGRLDDASVRPFQRAFDSLSQTSAFQHLCADAVADTLLVTSDFARTVDLTPCSTSDDFVRPVKWILTSRSHHGLLLIISPYEANALLSEIRKASQVGLHIYSAKTSKAMRHFDDLKFYTVSGSPLLQYPDAVVSGQLGLFSGSLFFEGFSAYKAVTDFLAVLVDAAMNEEGVSVGSDGFVDENSRKRLSWPVSSPFKTSPIVFIKALTGIRRKGHVFSQTHLGHLLSGRFMTEDGFQRS